MATTTRHTPKASKIQQAYLMAQPTRKLFPADCRCMEVTKDKQYGILWERWLTPAGVSFVVFATPSWCEVFRPVSPSNQLDRYEADITAFIAEPRA